MSASLTVDPKKYARLANRILVKAIETEKSTTIWLPRWNNLMDKGARESQSYDPHKRISFGLMSGQTRWRPGKANALFVIGPSF